MRVDLILSHWPMFAHGVWMTLQLTFIAIAIGFVIALPAGIARARRVPYASPAINAYVYLFRGTPLLVQTYLVYYGLSQFDWIRASWAWTFLRDPWWCAVLAFSLNSGAYATEIIRGAVETTPKGEIEARVQEMLGLVQLEKFAKRAPHQLSGGQRQRVALARALAKRPRVLLLDEPLAALDKKLREKTQFELMEIQATLGTTFMIVTHDQEEAMTVADRIAVMDRGRIVQMGTPAEVYEQPATRYVAEFVGDVNLIDAKVTGADGGSPGKLVGIAAAQLQGDRVLGVVKADQALAVAMKHGRRRHHPGSRRLDQRAPLRQRRERHG